MNSRSPVRATRCRGFSLGEVDRSRSLPRSSLMLGAPPDLLILPPGVTHPCNIVPIDMSSGLTPRSDPVGTPGGPTPLTVRPSRECAGRHPPRGRISGRLVRALLRTPGVARVSQKHRAFVDLVSTPVRYDTSNTRALLGDTDIQCPRFESYVRELVRHVQARGRVSALPAPDAASGAVTAPDGDRHARVPVQMRRSA